MITTLLYTLVFVLAFPSLGYAECAWVLWQDVARLMQSSHGPPETLWQIGAAVRSHDACQSLMRREIEASAAKLRETGDARVDGDTLIAFGRDYTAVRRYVCYPDTVDPREPKGAGR